MQAQKDIRKQATSGDIDGFVNTLTMLLEGDKLSDSTKEKLKQILCNVENTADEGEITSPENIRAWLAQALNIDNVQTIYEDEAEQEEGKPFVIFHDEADAQQSVDSIVKGITGQGLNLKRVRQFRAACCASFASTLFRYLAACCEGTSLSYLDYYLLKAKLKEALQLCR